jgi:hypothetical protein
MSEDVKEELRKLKEEMAGLSLKEIRIICESSLARKKDGRRASRACHKKAD